MKNILVFKPELLRKARKNSGLTVKEVAAAIGYCPLMIYHWETGKNRMFVDILAGLADLYDISISDLFREEVKKEGDLIA